MAPSTDFADLRSTLSGVVLAPNDDGYDQARSAWNGDVDHRPAVIARCTSSQDVAAALAFATAEGLEVSVRGGAHSYRGTAITNGGVMIDLSGINTVSVDPDAKRVRVGGGATLGILDAATQEHGLAMPAGVISSTGIGGLTLGGGMGWLNRLGGLSIDNLISAEVVLASGEVVRAAEHDHPDLFWALRGGGGNFGVVTEFEFRLHDVGPLVNFGLFFWGLPQGTEALRFARDFIKSLPDRSGALIACGLCAPPAPFVPPEHQGQPGFGLLVVGYGTADEHQDLVAPIREAVPTLFEFVTPMPFTELQKMFDEQARWGILAYEKSLDIEDLSDEVIEVLVEKSAGHISPDSFAGIFCLGGAFSTVGNEDTAFGGSRKPHFVVNIDCGSEDRAEFEADRAWVRRMWDALQPFASNSGGYVNFMNEPDSDRVRTSYGAAKYDRLATIKAIYDPDNVFHLNANIRPAVRA